MLRFFRQLFRSSHPLDDDNLGDRARDITFRVVEDDDIPTCMALYRANEAAHFPSGLAEHFEARLRARGFLTLLAHRNHKAVGCCGIYYRTTPNGIPISFFCFGMVDPAHQRQGIGTAQALVRLALMNTSNDLGVAAMLAVPGSVSFYRRFGFDFQSEQRGDDGNTYPLGVLRVSQNFVKECQKVLAQRNISYPDVRNQIPHRKADEKSGEAPSDRPPANSA